MTFYKKMDEIAIIGLGIVDALGEDININWNRYLQAQSPISEIKNFDKKTYPAIKINGAFQINDAEIKLDFLDNTEQKNLDRYSIIGLYSANRAVLDANIMNKTNTGVIFGSLGGPQKLILENVSKLIDNKRLSPRQALAAQRDNLGYLICKKFGFKGINLCMTSACATGILMIDYAVRLLQAEVYDQILVGACDVMVDPIDIFMFQSIGALDLREPPISSPFDKDRKGFVMGEGACSLVLKSLPKAEKDGDNVLAVIKSIGFATELYHETGMDPAAIGARQSIDMALKYANLQRDQISIISCHATSTPNGDPSEYNIIKEYFPNSALMALKANIGHTMSACGLIELAYLIQSMNMNKIGRIANLKNPIDILISDNHKREFPNFKYGIKNSFGFGGKCAAVVVEKFDG